MDAAAFIAELEARDGAAVAAMRQFLERTEIGKQTALAWPDRHDYVVAAPTKLENLQRIANVLAAIPDRSRADVINIVRNNPICWLSGDSQEY